MAEFSNGYVRVWRDKWQGVVTVTETVAEGTKEQAHRRKVYKTLTKYHKTNQGTGEAEEVDVLTPTTKAPERGKRDAEKALGEWRAQLIAEDAARPKEDKPMDVGEWVEWCVELLEKSGSVDKSTIRGYRQQVRQIREAFGGVELADLTTTAIRKWEARLLDEGISPVGVRKAHVLLKTCMQDAVDEGQIDKTPFTRKTKPPKVVQKTPNALEQADYDAAISLLTNGRGTIPETAALLVLYTGMRREEVCALKWADVDFDARVFMVRDAIGIAEGGSYVKGTKRDKPPRMVPMRDGIVPILKAQEARQRADIEKANQNMSDHGRLTVEDAYRFSPQLYVLGGIDGSYQNPESLTRKLRPLADSVLPLGNQGKPLNFLALRHSFCTELVREGVDAVTGSQIVGNTPAVFAKYYVSTSDKVKRGVFEQMDRAQAEREEDRRKKAEESGEVLPFDKTGTTGE